MVLGSVRYTRVTDTPEDREDERAYEESDEDEVTVYIKQPVDVRQRDAAKRDTWVRVLVALVLLGIVMGFMYSEWCGWWSEPESFQSAGISEDTKNPEDAMNHHHHYHSTEDGQHDHDDDDGGGGGGGGDDDDDDDDDHHKHDSHSHLHPSLYHHAVVLTSSANCSRVGRELLQEGGNIVDAGLASLLCLGVVHPHTAGVGGAFTAILYNHTSRSLKKMHSSAPKVPLTSYGTPSLLQGVKALHSQFGRTEWSKLFRGAIELAEDGFHIDEALSRALKTHEDHVLKFGLCDLFCDASGRVKSPGTLAFNRNLSGLLRGASLNESHFPEKLAMKLAEDLSPSERPAFIDAVQRSHGEINDSVIAEGEKYTFFSAVFPFAGLMLSDILERVREQSLSFRSSGDLNKTAASYFSLLNLTQDINNTLDEELFDLNMQSSLVGVLDGHSNFIIISASLNEAWGSGRFLPSSGIVLNGFIANNSDLPYFNFPLVLKINNNDDAPSDGEEEEEPEVEVIAFSGGPSAKFNAAVLLHNRVDLGMAPLDAVSSPLLHLEHGSFMAKIFCLSFISNGSDVYRLFSEGDGQLQEVEHCSDGSLSMLLRLHAHHVSAYGAPATGAHADGY